ncbi:hypothetical protein [Flavobacterium sp. GCM10023249]|uniref:hypothetical protein n=1 Tax=unclassified Flavobacterium TaxID=196869 RepID=UPI003618B21C
MQTLKLSELIGKEITDIRFQYTEENQYGLQSFHAYLKLNDNTIIDIPQSDEDDYLELTTENIDYLQKKFDSSESINELAKKYCIGQKIVDFFFFYSDDEFDIGTSGYIKLSNGYYLSEINYGPPGITTVDLILLNESKFENHRNNPKMNIRSFLNSLQ